MGKKVSNKAVAVAVLEAALVTPEAGYERAAIKTPYLWPDEVVWQRNWTRASTFVVYGPSPKRAGEAAIYLCWSAMKRFPQVSMRPSLLLGAGGAAPATKPEGSILLPDLAPGLASWVRYENAVDPASCLAPYLDLLKVAGLPYLARLADEVDSPSA